MFKNKRWHLGNAILFILSISFCFLLNSLLINPIHSQVLPAMPATIAGIAQTINSGEDYYKAKQYHEAISFWLAALKSAPTDKVRANIHINLASAYQLLGKPTEAVAHWEQAAKIYEQQPNNQSRLLLAKTLIDRAQVYNDLGQFRSSIPLLEQAISIAQQQRNIEVSTVAQGVLGNAYRLAGEYDKSLSAYQTSLELAQKLGNAERITIALNNQVNLLQVRYTRYLTQSQSAQQEKDAQEEARLTALAQQDKGAAIAAANRAVQASKNVGGVPQVKALLNIISLSSPQQDLTASYEQQAISITAKLPPSRSKAYALIQLAQYQIGKQKVNSLETASAISASLNDYRTQSFALGALGHVYEEAGQLQQAMNLTRQAQNAAQSVWASDSLYRWQWQVGRIYKASGAPDEAISSYKSAIATLQSIRGDIVSANTDLQFDVRDSVEPVYRELMALLLDKGEAGEALSVSELLKLTELQSFFGDECLQVKLALSSTQQVEAKEAVINSLILNDRTYLILRLPDGTLKSYPVPLNAAQIQDEVKQFRSGLEDFGTNAYVQPAQRLYNLLLRSMEADLAKSQPNTLVFINDGVLRNIPMAALHDGKQFLVQKYAICAKLGLNMSAQRQQQRQEQEALVFGLTVKVPPFKPLPNVNAETEAVRGLLGGKRFLDREFTLANLEKQIGEQKNYSVVHLATHGKFRGTADSTFLQAYDRRIFLREFEDILLANSAPMDLLTLSACQTAAGDNRSTLGIAGLAARTGVRNVLASLWFVNDSDTVPLMEKFYSYLRQPGITKAEALRKAQLSVISIPNSHPNKWSSFILVSI